MTKTTKSGTGIARYLQVYRVLSQALAEGRFGADQLLPSEPRLMKDYGVSRSTVRRALARLEAEGHIERRRGSGTFARALGGSTSARPGFGSALDAKATRTGGGTRRTISLQRIPTPAFLLGEQARFGATALVIRQVRYLGRQPFALETSWVPEKIGGGLTRRRVGTGHGAVLSMLASAGHRARKLDREFAAIEADPLAANSLGLAVGTPILNVRTLALDAQRGVLAYISCVYRPDRYEAHLTIEIDRPSRDRAGRRS